MAVFTALCEISDDAFFLGCFQLFAECGGKEGGTEGPVDEARRGYFEGCFYMCPVVVVLSFKFPDVTSILRSYFSTDAIDGKLFTATVAIGFAFY